ncbi:uncharacterized protein LOC107974658 isoform X2 [Pan troglodytes]|uniref:uncharacterized protein LOC107974658 isoform X2 n=1 Tax=Pan troglodytes TaxID=9598 RepID=UPI003013C81D
MKTNVCYLQTKYIITEPEYPYFFISPKRVTCVMQWESSVLKEKVACGTAKRTNIHCKDIHLVVLASLILLVRTPPRELSVAFKVTCALGPRNCLDRGFSSHESCGNSLNHTDCYKVEEE